MNYLFLIIIMAFHLPRALQWFADSSLLEDTQLITSRSSFYPQPPVLSSFIATVLLFLAGGRKVLHYNPMDTDVYSCFLLAPVCACVCMRVCVLRLVLS